MKINFKKIFARNFLSIGNRGLSFEYKPGLFRVSGENLDNQTRNGVGKSLLTSEILCYGLFGKPMRKISLADLPNTINDKKGCEVKLQFSIEDKNYMIHRGIKPDFLKFYEDYEEGDENKKNNAKEKEDSAKKYTQKRIDELVKAGFNTLSHILVMSNSYTAPFLDLDKNKKREIVESILGVSVFSNITDLAKDKSLDLKSDLKVNEKEYELEKTSLDELTESQRKLKEKSDLFEQNKKARIKSIMSELKLINAELEDYKSKLVEDDTLEDKTNKLKKFLKKTEASLLEVNSSCKSNKQQVAKLEKKIEDIQAEPICPRCGTETNTEHVISHIAEMKGELELVISNIKKDEDSKIELETKIEQIQEKITLNEDIITKNQTLTYKIEKLILNKQNLAKQVDEIKSEVNNFDELIDENQLKDKLALISVLETKINSNSIERDYYEYIRKILSNSGIKNYIIKKVLKYWNTKLNYYLSKLNAEFSIAFDEELEATIKSRNRDPLTYHSFSGGEKARIDVAILLSIIDISKLQNSVDLNVVVIDELLDSGLDDTGREDVLYLLKEITTSQNKSIYVVSHNQNLPTELFDEEIMLYKKNGFTSFDLT